MRTEKAERILVWWAQVLFDDAPTNAYPDHAAFVDVGSGFGSGFGSRPLVHGQLRDDWQVVDALLRGGELSPRQYIAAFFAFLPWRDEKGHHVNCRLRAAKAECSLATLKLAKARAVRLVMSNEDVIYRRPVGDYMQPQAAWV